MTRSRPYLLGIHLAWAVLLSITNPIAVSAEGYVAGQLGVLLKTNLTSVDRTAGFIPTGTERVSDIKLTTSPLYGIKLGYYGANFNWLGGEAEFFRTNPDWVGQPLSSPSFPTTLSPTHMEVSTLAFNILFRYPHHRIQPYGGIGLGLFWANAVGSQGGPSGRSSFSPGLNLLAGVRFFLSESVSIFTEYKYNRTTLDFPEEREPGAPGFKADYRPQHIVVGIGFHF
jgi:opacity protein-like surface antigen